MDTVSLLVSRHALAASRSILLVGLLASIGLILLVVGEPGLAEASRPLPADPELAPFRWRVIPANLA